MNSRLCLLASTAVAVVGLADAIAHPLDAYVQDDSLIAWWDGEYNSVVDGNPVHQDDATQWDSLVPGAAPFESELLVYRAQSVVYQGKRLFTTIANMPQVSTTPVTVQIVARCVTERSLNQTHQLFSTWHGDWGMTTDMFTLIGAAWNQQANIALKTSMRNLQVNTFIYRAGGFSCYENQDLILNLKSLTGQPTPNTNFTIGSSRDDRCDYEYFAIRVYARELTAAEIRQNLVADMNHFGFCPDGLCTLPLPFPLTTDAYAQDGLYAQWDGLCNATNGGLHHSENPMQWVDLKGNAPAFEGDALTFMPDRVSVSEKTPTSIAWLAGDPREWTMELSACCSYNAHNSSMDIMLFGSCGGVAYFSKNSQITGGGPALDNGQYRRFQLNGPVVTGESPHTYSLSLYVDDFAKLAIDGVDVQIAKANAKDLVNHTDSILRLGSEQANPCHFDYYSVRIYDRQLSTEERQLNARIDNARFFGQSAEMKLVVAGDPHCIGTVTPGYGDYCGLEVGDVVLCSAPLNTKKGELVGYEVQTNDVDGVWHTMSQGKSSTFYLTIPEAQTKVVWHWKQPSGMMLIVW